MTINVPIWCHQGVNMLILAHPQGGCTKLAHSLAVVLAVSEHETDGHYKMELMVSPLARGKRKQS